MATRKHPFAVRQQTSGYTGASVFIVVRNPGGRRVSVHPYVTRSAAQQDADLCNITELVKPYDTDPRPLKDRYADAEATYRAERVGCPYCHASVGLIWRDGIAYLRNHSRVLARQRGQCIGSGMARKRRP